MVYAKRRRSTRPKRSKRSYIRKRIYKRRSIPRSFYPLGKSRVLKLKYVEEISLNATSGAISTYIFSANGLYDPNVTGTGHQPYGFDQIMAMYNHYTVLGSKCIVRCANNQTNLPIVIALALRPDITTLTDPVRLLEQPGVKKRVLQAESGGSSNGVLTMNFSAKKFWGEGKSVSSDSTLSGDVSANPTDQAFYHVCLCPQASDSPSSQVMWVEISFIALFKEPKMLSQS